MPKLTKKSLIDGESRAEQIYKDDCEKLSDGALIDSFIDHAEYLVFTLLRELQDVFRNKHEPTFHFSTMSDFLWRMDVERMEMRERGKLKIPKKFWDDWVNAPGLKELPTRDIYFAYLNALYFLHRRYDIHYFRDAEHERQWFAETSVVWNRIKELHEELERRRAYENRA